MLSVIIPTYNERENIKQLIPIIYSVFVDNQINGEVLVVDDNSPDGTGDIVKELQDKYESLQLITRSSKEGLGVAYLEGYAKAKGEIIVSMDADLSHDPKEIPTMLKKIEEGYELVIGSRYTEGGKVLGKSKLNVFASKVACKLSRIGLGIDVSDFTNGYRMFKKNVYKSMKNEEFSKGNTFLVEFIYFTYLNGFRISEVPITFIERKRGKTKTNLLKETKALIGTILKLRFGKKF
jgi:dolichol-phosphate mannosyltransferase